MIKPLKWLIKKLIWESNNFLKKLLSFIKWIKSNLRNGMIKIKKIKSLNKLCSW